MLELLLLPVLLSGAALLAHQHQKPSERLSIMAVKPKQAARSPRVTDQSFIDNAARCGMYGLLLGTLGMEKSQNPDLIALAETMVRENQAINVELASILEPKGMSSGKTLNPDQRGVLQQLSQLSGPAFDSRFLMTVLVDRQEMLNAFLEETDTGKDKDLQKFAADNITRLKGYLHLARKAKESSRE